MCKFAVLNYLLNSGDLGNFSEEEKLLASEVFFVASEEIERNGGFNSDDDSDDDEADASFKEKVEATMKNFKKIIRLFKEAEKAKLHFMKRFPKWSPRRLETIAKFKELAKKINTDRLNCNISTLTSTCVSILGGAAFVASFLFPPAAPILVPGGLAAAGLGGATVFGTSVTEISLLKKDMDVAAEVKKKDEEDFKLVGLWFKHSQELIDAFEKIMGFSVASEMSEDLKNFNAERMKSERKIPSNLKTVIKNFVTKMLPAAVAATGGGAATAATVAATSSVAVALIPIVISFFVVIVLLRKYNRLVFDSVVLSYRVAFGMMRLLDIGGDLGLLISNAILKAGGMAGTEVSKAAARVVAHGVFAGIGLALDVTNLIFASIDVHKKSISPYATQLSEAADHLEKEHKLLSEIYDKLFNLR